MNINQLYAFTTVYETENFSEAARIMNITQSAVTQLVHGLEKSLNTPLFIRSKRPITPTENGLIYYSYAKQIIQLHEESLQALNKATHQFTLSYRFTSEGIIDRYLFSNPLERPDSIKNLSLEDFNSSSNWKENTLYFVRKDIIKSKNIFYTPAYSSKIYAAVSTHSNLSDHNLICLSDLINKTVILPKSTSRTILANKLYQLFSHDSEIHIKETDSNFDGSLRYVSLYDYVAFCTEEFKKQYDSIKYIEFESDIKFEYGFACIGSPTKEMNDLIHHFKNWKKQNDIN